MVRVDLTEFQLGLTQLNFKSSVWVNSAKFWMMSSRPNFCWCWLDQILWNFRQGQLKKIWLNFKRGHFDRIYLKVNYVIFGQNFARGRFNIIWSRLTLPNSTTFRPRSTLSNLAKFQSDELVKFDQILESVLVKFRSSLLLSN